MRNFRECTSTSILLRCGSFTQRQPTIACSRKPCRAPSKVYSQLCARFAAPGVTRRSTSRQHNLHHGLRFNPHDGHGRRFKCIGEGGLGSARLQKTLPNSATRFVLTSVAE